MGSKIQILGQCRVTALGAFTTNSGFFSSIAHNGAGDDTHTVDTGQLGLAASTDVVVQCQVEGAAAGESAIEYLTVSTFRVRLLNNAGVALAAAYNLTAFKTLDG